LAGPEASSAAASAAASWVESSYHSGFRDAGVETDDAGAVSRSGADVAGGMGHA
jgi:hypothetical protein